jgi:hypothetical protein
MFLTHSIFFQTVGPGRPDLRRVGWTEGWAADTPSAIQRFLRVKLKARLPIQCLLMTMGFAVGTHLRVQVRYGLGGLS